MVLHTNDPRVSHARIKFPSEGASMSKGEGKKSCHLGLPPAAKNENDLQIQFAMRWPRARRRGGWLVDLVQGSAKRQSPGLVIVVPALAYHFCPALLAAFTQPGTHLLAKPSSIASWCD